MDAQATLEYLSTPKGQAELKAAFERGREEADRIKEAVKMGLDSLRVPFGPKHGWGLR